MNHKSYHIPDDQRSYSREPRKYIPRPAPPRAAPPQRPTPRSPAKLQFQRSSIPSVSRLQPLVRYQPVALTKPPKAQRRPSGGQPNRTVQPAQSLDSRESGHQLQAQRQEDQRRKQAEHQRRQQAHQAEHQRQQQAIQQAHQQRRDIERQRTQATDRREKKHLEKLRADQHRPSPPEPSHSDLDLEPLPPSRQPRQSASSGDDLKAEIRRRIAAELAAKNADENTAPQKSGGCIGNIVVFLIIGTILYFAVCSGIIDEFFG